MIIARLSCSLTHGGELFGAPHALSSLWEKLPAKQRLTHRKSSSGFCQYKDMHEGIQVVGYMHLIKYIVHVTIALPEIQ